LHWIETYRTPILLVVTKSDQLPKGRHAPALDKIRASLPPSVAREDLHLFSSKTGQGRDALLAQIVKFLQSEPIQPKENGQFSSRH
jgi:GTP-binding protein EngB required for normal cell division